MAYPVSMKRSGFERMFVAKGVLCCATWLWSAAGAAAQSQEALVYARDPEQTPRPELLALPLPAEAGGLRHPWLTAFSCVDTGAFASTQTGERVRVCSQVQSAAPDAQGRFTAAPVAADELASAADPFAEQMLFYHGARTLRFFADLGLAPTRESNALQLIANMRLPGAEALQPWCDASFVRADEDAGMLTAMQPKGAARVYFGADQGLRVAYDAAAIRHEVSHAALAAWLPRQPWFVDDQGPNPAPAAIAEALADYFAAAIAGDPRLGAYAGHGTQQLLTRNLNVRLHCPAALSGEPHQDGLLIASALWAARKELGDALDKALVNALKKLRAPAALGVEKLLAAVLRELGAKHTLAAQIFRERGLGPSCQRVVDLHPEQSFSGATGRLALLAGPHSASVLQLRAAIPSDATQVELRLRAAPLPASTLDAGAFQPALLVSSAPIRWTRAGPHNAMLVSAAESSTLTEMRFLVPVTKAQSLYFQVVNRGQRPGWFDAVRVIVRR